MPPREEWAKEAQRAFRKIRKIRANLGNKGYTRESSTIDQSLANYVAFLDDEEACGIMGIREDLANMKGAILKHPCPTTRIIGEKRVDQLYKYAATLFQQWVI